MIHGLGRIPAVTMPRQCGGWLAITPLTAPVRVGVLAPTEDEARKALRVALDRWAAILNDDAPPNDRPVTPAHPS